MDISNNILKYLTDSAFRWKVNYRFGAYSFLSDEKFLVKKFQMLYHEKIDLKIPKTFTEKIQWLKLYDRKPVYTVLQDKYLVREYISQIVGNQYLIPLLGVYDKAEDIDFKSLPNQFVLKCNHDSNSIQICRDKSTFDFERAKNKLNSCLKNNFWDQGKEWAYKNISPKIIAEKYVEESNEEQSAIKGLRDYKFFCFDGEPKFLYVSKGLENHSTARMIHLNLDWTPTPFQRIGYELFDEIPEKPKKFDEMIGLCSKLSRGIPFTRIDLYEINNKVYFGEYTLYPASGSGGFVPNEWNEIIGSWINLPYPLK